MIDQQANKEEECSVCVAVKIRPLVPSELEQGSRSCLLVAPGIPQVLDVGLRNRSASTAVLEVFVILGTTPVLISLTIQYCTTSTLLVFNICIM